MCGYWIYTLSHIFTYLSYTDLFLCKHVNAQKHSLRSHTLPFEDVDCMWWIYDDEKLYIIKRKLNKIEKKKSVLYTRVHAIGCLGDWENECGARSLEMCDRKTKLKKKNASLVLTRTNKTKMSKMNDTNTQHDQSGKNNADEN